MPGGLIPPEQIKTGSPRDRRSRGAGRQEGARSRGSCRSRHGRHVLINAKVRTPGTAFRGPFLWEARPIISKKTSG